MEQGHNKIGDALGFFDDKPDLDLVGGTRECHLLLAAHKFGVIFLEGTLTSNIKRSLKNMHTL